MVALIRGAAPVVVVCLLALITAGPAGAEPAGPDAGGGAARGLAQALRDKRDARPKRALAAVNELLAETPDQVEALWLRAWLHAAAGHRLQAVADFRRVLALTPTGPHATEARAALQRLGVPVTSPPAPPRTPLKPGILPTLPTAPAGPPQAKPVASAPSEGHSTGRAAAPEPTSVTAARPPATPAEPAVTETPTVPAAPVVAPQPPPDVLYRQAEMQLRMRRYSEAVLLLASVVQAAPGFAGGRACGKLARACLLARASQKALDLLAPLRASWQGDAYACHQVALCRYAVAHLTGLDLAGVPAAVAAAFAVRQDEYPIDAPQIRNAAAHLFTRGMDDRARAKAAYDFVRLRTQYDKSLIPVGRQSVLFTLASGRAVCTGFAQLYITLCRAGGIPARLVSGEGDTGFHNWAEVWLVGKGWVPVDPTRGSTRSTHTFGRIDSDVRPYPDQRENW